MLVTPGSERVNTGLTVCCFIKYASFVVCIFFVSSVTLEILH